MILSVRDLLSLEYLYAANLDGLKKKSIKGVSTDSRTVKSGDIFFALRGEKFDGHEFVVKAFNAGAVCAVVDEKADQGPFQGRTYIVVSETTKALGHLANVYRKKFDIPVLAIAGSNGKTTTKEMIIQILKKKYSVHSTQGNLNNHIGVPQTLFGLKRSHEVAVLELGTNHFGELAYLCGIAVPTHGLITNIGREHLEFFEGLDGVAKAEGELFESINISGVGFLNADDQYVTALAKKLKKKITFGFSKWSVDVHGKLLATDADGYATFRVKPRQKNSFDVKLRVPGEHVMFNALAAAAVGLNFRVAARDIKHALQQFRAVSKRMEVRTVGGVTIINDSYNANPDSVISALCALKSMKSKGHKIVILGDMLELGLSTQMEHHRVGAMVTEMGFEYLLTYGPAALYIHESANVSLNLHYDQKNILAEYAVELVSPGDIVLVKGSRGMKMEEVVLFMHERLEGKTQ